MESHNYRQLSGRHIRLLRLNSDIMGTNSGSLAEFDLDTPPPFYALSHCWGTDNRDKPIYIGNEIFLVGLDLAAGIQRLRELAMEKSPLNPAMEYIWIDTICINQGDTVERSSQVRMMDDIYSRAIRTIIWLGSSDDSCSLAWELVDNIYAVFRAQHPTVTSPDEIPARTYSESHHSRSGLPAWTDERWRSLGKLCNLRWFSRIWVVQEVVLSTKDPIIVHGNNLYPWHRFEWAATWMRRSGYLRLPHLPQALLHIDNIGYLRRVTSRWPLHVLMSITQMKFRASDQRDKIYGLLGLAAETQNTAKLPEALVPDYNLSVQDLYQNATRYFLKQTGSLAVLTRAQGTNGSFTRRRHLHQFPDFPSWVTNWSDLAVGNMDIRKSLCLIHSSDALKPVHLGFPENYFAAGNIPLMLHDSEDSSILRLSGLRVDRIEQATQLSDEHMLYSDFYTSVASVVARVCAVALPLLKGNDVDAWAAQLIRVTSAGQYDAKFTGRGWDQFFKDGLACLYRLFLDNEDQRSVFISRSGMGQMAMNWLKNVSENGEPDVYIAMVRNFCYSRTFLITSGGRMGIGPADSMRGDAITVIPGGAVPYVIRNDATTLRGIFWAFVGESYISGLMDGEAIEEHGRGSIEMEVLDFR
ncbi:heterokaryon incompatibility protein-domain-containing protein [Corynascus novoguineensis]|uniref:Heterokaryon incompatibility protein-domain-containing protein n=1 Tax=Corynascus novoguineensis TaxID=1126955 RepID=A0AAN7CLN1_9PEZI|nr:heterokaryon incompatibility protein-domain-containing protein [Corynascus novoguineensis]